jgi:hypothetical protein
LSVSSIVAQQLLARPELTLTGFHSLPCPKILDFGISDRHLNLLYGNNYGCKTFYDTGPWSQSCRIILETFYDCNLQLWINKKLKLL